MDEGIDEMIDESRNNGIDDDGDWNPISDDVGLDRLADTGDPGENDGKPTSGARFGFPGEPNVDVTDVSETDQIGLTGSFYKPIPNGLTHIRIMRYGIILWYREIFSIQLISLPGDYNLYASSGLFSLQPGQTEPISLAVILANGPVQDQMGNIENSNFR